jgi:Putative restriction endonuclease
MAMSSDLERSPVEAISSPEERPYLFSVDQFYAMVDLDILPQDNRAYLWDGNVFEKPLYSTQLAANGMKVLATMFRAVPSGWFCSFNNSLTIGPDKSPTPDMVVLRGKPDDYRHRRPDAADTGLVIEMTEETCSRIIARKLAAYASAGIPACWIVNLADEHVVVHEIPIPSEGRFASVGSFRRGESIHLTLDRTASGLIAASNLLLAPEPTDCPSTERPSSR